MATDIGRDSRIVDFIMRRVLSWFTKDMDQGSSTTLFCCLAPHQSLGGRFFSHCKLAERSSLADDDNAREVLWKLSEELCAEYRNLEPKAHLDGHMQCGASELI